MAFPLMEIHMGKLLNQKLDAPLGYIEEYVTRAQFTDGGAAAGTYVMKSAIPVGAHVLATTVTQITGFTGDTSAVLIVGDGTDHDRYNTSTVNVFATATAVTAGIPSGVQGHSAAIYPTLTVTSNADFTNVTAGAMKVSIFYVKG
jgi:hypothetical protein